MMDAASDGFSDLRDLYQDIILDRGRAPRHMRLLDPSDASAQRDNPLCGDRVDVRVRVSEAGEISEIAFEGRGCAISLASADLMVDAASGQTPGRIRALAKAFADLVDTGEAPEGDPALDMLRPLSGVCEYRSRVKCAMLPWNALVASLDNIGVGDMK